MPDSQDYRDLLNERFASLNAKIDSNNEKIHDSLGSIITQTTRTNGKVLDLEKKVSTLEISDITHSLRCPKQKQFDEISKEIHDLRECVNDKMADLTFWVKNPKLGLAIIVVAVIVTLFSYFEITTYIEGYREHKTEATE